MSDAEFFSYPHVVAMGRRKMLLPPDRPAGKKPKEWEVYVRLISGSSFTLASGVGRKSAGKELGRLAHEMAEQTGCSLVTMPNDCVPFEHVARVYVDAQENEHIAVLEDSSGATYELERGSQQTCANAVHLVAGTILAYMQQKGEAT